MMSQERTCRELGIGMGWTNGAESATTIRPCEERFGDRSWWSIMVRISEPQVVEGEFEKISAVSCTGHTLPIFINIPRYFAHTSEETS